MALSFPLSLQTVYDMLFIEDAVFTPARNDSTSGLGNNQPVHAELASPLWKADVSTMPLENDDSESLAALMEVLERPGNDFYLCNPRKLFPRADPDGTLLGSATPTLDSVNINNRQIAIAGLPGGYTLSRGDVFSFEYGPTGQKRRAFHRFTETMVATSGGVISAIEVYPHIRTGAVGATPITLIKAAMRAKLVPGTYKPAGYGALHQRVSFTAIQKLI